MRFYILLFFFLTISSKDFKIVDNTIYHLKNLEFKKANLELKTLNNNNLKVNLLLLIKIVEDDRQTDLSKLDTRLNTFKLSKDDSNLNKIIKNLIQGFIHLNYKKNRSLAFKNFTTSYELAKATQNIILEKYSLYCLLQLYLKGVLLNDNTYQIYLDKYKLMCKDNIDWLYYHSFRFNLIGLTKIYNEKKVSESKSRKAIFSEYENFVNSVDNSKTPFLHYYRDKANFVIRENPKLAEKLFIKCSTYFKDSNYFKFLIYNNFCNLSRVYSLLNKHKTGLKFLNEAKKYISFNDSLLDQYDISIHKANHFFNLKIYDSAYIYEKNVRFLTYKVNFQQHNTEVSKLKVELDTEKKEKQILELEKDNLETEAKRIKNRNFLIGALLLMLLTGIIGVLSLKSSKRKRKLAEQQKELETQKNLTLLKEQELTTINAMVDGQEKERKRIAEDLHDNLGSVLATLKLHFENLQINKEKKKINQDELFNKTESLIDEAYLKVRSIAHAKNAGVIANQGLLTAVQMMAEKISSADKIKIEVVDFGLDKRLENSLEITVFRIIQELITNIIKHAEAKNATINISLYNKNLNIIIEDNGKGFNIKKVNLKNGMGISSIKTRVEHLKGTFKVDSTIHKGTSIIIDIPIE